MRVVRRGWNMEEINKIKNNVPDYVYGDNCLNGYILLESFDRHMAEFKTNLCTVRML